MTPGPDNTLTTAVEARQAEAEEQVLLLKAGNTELSIYFPNSIVNIAKTIYEEVRGDGDEGTTSEFDLIIRMAGRAVGRFEKDKKAAYKSILRTLCNAIEGRFLKGNDPHPVFAQQAKMVSLKEALSILYRAREIAAIEAVHNLPKLFQAAVEGETRLMAVFGGQGNTEDLLGELEDLKSVYGPIVSGYLAELAQVLLECSQDGAAKDHFTRGLDILAWLQDPQKRPDQAYILGAPVSMPLIGLIQLATYWILWKGVGGSPGELARRFVATTGHSQGIVTAAVIAGSRTEEELVENGKQALRLLFWIGLRSQKAFPTTTLSPNALKDSVEHGEGVPSPMLAIRNLDLEQLVEHISFCNEHLPSSRKIELCLKNGPKSFICCGPPQSLYALNLRLRKRKADPSEDQSRIPFAERKVNFSNRFLPISTAFHSQYLVRAVPEILGDVRRHGIALLPVNIPVLHTRSGIWEGSFVI